MSDREKNAEIHEGLNNRLKKAYGNKYDKEIDKLGQLCANPEERQSNSPINGYTEKEALESAVRITKIIREIK